MSGTAICGVQWGDEGKGKIVDQLAARANMVVRYQGGNNAGHTLVVKKKKRVVHLIPSGVLYPNVLCLISRGMVVDPDCLLQEINGLRSDNIKCDNLRIDASTPLILPWHQALDAVREDLAGKAKIGTTLRGIGPAYEDVANRQHCFRFRDLQDMDRLADRLHAITLEKMAIINSLAQLARDQGRLSENTHQLILNLDTDQNLVTLIQIWGHLKPFIIDDAISFVNEALERDDEVLFEGAQGVLLDIMNGTYPYVTSSHPVPSTITTMLHVPPDRITRRIAVAKAYTTRVGSGPFPTELTGSEADHLQQVGGEYGATTGRPRRCGWLDLPALRYGLRAIQATEVWLTKFDVLYGLPQVKANNGYLHRGQTIQTFNPHQASEYQALNNLHFPGWRHYTDSMARQYLEAVQLSLDGIPITHLTDGPKRGQIVKLAA